jgi:23S rRNA (cytosine1962-C5)-methyltransferase
LPSDLNLPPGAPVVTLRNAGFGTFIYEKMIGRVFGSPANGDLVAVIDKFERFFGWGFYNSRSQIALRMFWHRQARPTDADIAARVRAAVEFRRRTLRLDDSTDAYRLIHAEGDGLSGLIADRFGQYVVLELFSLAMVQRLEMIQDAIIDAGLSVKEFIVRADKLVGQHEGFNPTSLPSSKASQTVINENGVKFQVQLATGHKTGFFCDQRENRLALTAFTPGKSVLDVCCYSGGFACYAAKLGGAKSVTAVDLDENALVTAKANARLNEARIDFNHADAFDFLRNAADSQKRWDVVVVDPSKFVQRRDEMEIGLRKYTDLNRLAAAAVAPGGLLLSCSCSGLVDQLTFVDTLARGARAAGRALQIFRITAAAPDHPFMADSPQSAYLKAVWARVD